MSKRNIRQRSGLLPSAVLALPQLSISDLPTEVQSYILRFLPTKDRAAASLVCRAWRRAERSSRTSLSLTTDAWRLKDRANDFSDLRELTISGTPKGLGAALLQASLYCKQLQWFTAEHTAVPASGLRALVHGCPMLESLRLHGCAGGVDTGLLCDIGARLKRLRVLHVGGMVVKGEGRPGCRCALRDGEPHGLACALSGCPDLHDLNLTEGSLACDASLKSIAWHGGHALTSLDVSGASTLMNRLNGVTDIGLVAMAESRDVKLKHLVLDFCGDITAEGVSSLLRARGANLRILRLRAYHPGEANVANNNNNIPPPVNADTVANALSAHCPRLRKLDVSNAMHTLTDAGLRALAAGCKELKVLNVSKCERITEAGVNGVLANCKELMSLVMRECSGVEWTRILEDTDNTTSSNNNNAQHNNSNGEGKQGENGKGRRRRCKIVPEAYLLIQ